eukprot:249536_1
MGNYMHLSLHEPVYSPGVHNDKQQTKDIVYGYIHQIESNILPCQYTIPQGITSIILSFYGYRIISIAPLIRNDKLLQKIRDHRRSNNRNIREIDRKLNRETIEQKRQMMEMKRCAKYGGLQAVRTTAHAIVESKKRSQRYNTFKEQIRLFHSLLNDFQSQSKCEASVGADINDKFEQLQLVIFKLIRLQKQLNFRLTVLCTDPLKKWIDANECNVEMMGMYSDMDVSNDTSSDQLVQQKQNKCEEILDINIRLLKLMND